MTTGAVGGIAATTYLAYLYMEKNDKKWTRRDTAGVVLFGVLFVVLPGYAFSGV